MTPGPSNIDDTEGGHENDDILPSLEELLFGAGEVQESQRARLSVEHGIGRSDRTFEHPTQNDCDNTSTSGPRQGGDRGGDIDDSSSVHPRSDSSTSEEQGGEHCSLSTPSTSVAGSEARYDPWKPRSLILILTDGAYLDVPSSTRRQKIPSLILLQSLIPSSRRHKIHKSTSKISSFIAPVGGKRKGTKERAAVQTTSSHTLSDCPLRCQILNCHWFHGGLRSEKTP